jgi:hypothetical protein
MGYLVMIRELKKGTANETITNTDIYTFNVLWTITCG